MFKFMLFSILIPAIYLILLTGGYIISRFSYIDNHKWSTCPDDKAKSVRHGILYGCAMTVFVIGEELLSIWAYKHIGINIFYAPCGTGGMLITLAIVLGIISIIYIMGALEDGLNVDDNDWEGICFTIEFICLIFGLIVVFANRSMVQDELISKMEYKVVNESSVKIQEIDNTSGNYIVINSSTNELYYSTTKDNGSIIQDKLSYNTSTFDIFENDNETPRIDITTHGRQLLAPDGHVLREEYYDTYVIYIPTGTYSGEIQNNK